MPLYSSFSTSDYYDDEPKNKQKKVTSQHQKHEQNKKIDYKKPHQSPNNYGLTEQKRKSLYEEAQEVASTSSEYDHIDFRSLYRVGQMIMVQRPNGNIATRKGRIVEIVAKNLMYVGMEDTHKDVHGNWLVDFVKSDDKITRL